MVEAQLQEPNQTPASDQASEHSLLQNRRHLTHTCEAHASAGRNQMDRYALDPVVRQNAHEPASRGIRTE